MPAHQPPPAPPAGLLLSLVHSSPEDPSDHQAGLILWEAPNPPTLSFRRSKLHHLFLQAVTVRPEPSAPANTTHPPTSPQTPQTELLTRPLAFSGPSAKLPLAISSPTCHPGSLRSTAQAFCVTGLCKGLSEETTHYTHGLNTDQHTTWGAGKCWGWGGLLTVSISYSVSRFQTETCLTDCSLKSSRVCSNPVIGPSLSSESSSNRFGGGRPPRPISVLISAPAHASRHSIPQKDRSQQGPRLCDVYMLRFLQFPVFSFLSTWNSLTRL